MKNTVQIVIAAAFCAIGLLLLVAFLFKSPSLTVLGWIAQDPGRALLIAGAGAGVVLWWCRSMDWRDYEGRDNGGGDF